MLSLLKNEPPRYSEQTINVQLFTMNDKLIPVPVLRRPVDVSKGPDVRHVLGDEADLVHRVVVQTILHN